MYDVLDIAKYIIKKCVDEEEPISNLQLQKILYFIQRDYLMKFDEPLFEENIVAWKFGPVVVDVYYKYCNYGALKLNKHIEIEIPFKRKERKLIDNVIVEKRRRNPWELVEETHKEGSPWYETCTNEGLGSIITKELIRENN